MTEPHQSQQPGEPSDPERPIHRTSVEERLARREARAQRRAERRAAYRGWGGGWIGGAILILLGLIFLAQNFGLQVFGNWWALFILIPAFGSLATAWRLYQANDSHLTPAARGSLITGGILTVVALAFLFNLNWGIVGPLILIAGGVALLINFTSRQ